MDTDPPRDARTTPKAWRAPALALLSVLIAYYFVSYRFAVADIHRLARPPALAPSLREGWDFWMGQWRMFAVLSPKHFELTAERADADGTWSPLRLADYYTDPRVEGPGYHRKDFWRQPHRLARMADDLCRRGPRGTAAVRLLLHRWPKTLGSREQPRRDEQVEVVQERTCGGVPPAGRTR